MAKQPVRMVCETCRSEEVTRDAWAEWQAEAQQWVLGALFDYAYCHRCQGSTHLAAVPPEPPAARRRRRFRQASGSPPPQRRDAPLGGP